MTHDEIKFVKIGLLKLATITGKTLDPEALNFFAEILSENITLPEFIQVTKKWASSRRTFPTPADLIEMARPLVQSEDEAQRAVSALIAAIRNHDYTWPMYRNPAHYKTGSFLGDLTLEVGDLGVLLVERWGGWGAICESFHDMEEGTFRAQLRDLTESTIRMAKAGKLNWIPELPKPARIELLEGGSGRPERIDAANLVEDLRKGIGST